MLTCSVDQESLQKGVTIISSDYEVATDKDMTNLVAHSYGEVGNEYSVIFDYELERGRDYYGRIRCILSTGPIDWGEPTKLTYDDDTINFNMAIPSAINAPILNTIFWREEHPHTNFTIFGDEFTANGNTKHVETQWTITEIETGTVVLTRRSTVELRKLYVDIVLDFNKAYKIDAIYKSDNDGYSPRGGLVVSTTCPLVRDGTPTMMSESTDMIVYKNGVGRPNALHEWFLYDEENKVTQTYIPGVPEVVGELTYSGVDVSLLNPVIITDEKYNAIKLGSENDYGLRIGFEYELSNLKNDLVFATNSGKRVVLLVKDTNIAYNTTNKYNFTTNVVNDTIYATYVSIATTDELVPDVPIVYTPPYDLGTSSFTISEAKFIELKSALDAGKPIMVNVTNEIIEPVTNIVLNTNSGKSLVLSVGNTGVTLLVSQFYKFTRQSTTTDTETVVLNNDVKLDVDLIFAQSTTGLGFTETTISDSSYVNIREFTIGEGYARITFENTTTGSEGFALINNTAGTKAIKLTFPTDDIVLTGGVTYKFDLVEDATDLLTVVYVGVAPTVTNVSTEELTYDGERVSLLSKDVITTTERTDILTKTKTESGFIKTNFSDSLIGDAEIILTDNTNEIKLTLNGNYDANTPYAFNYDTGPDESIVLKQITMPSLNDVLLVQSADLNNTEIVLSDTDFDTYVGFVTSTQFRLSFDSPRTFTANEVVLIRNTSATKTMELTVNYTPEVTLSDSLIVVMSDDSDANNIKVASTQTEKLTAIDTLYHDGVVMYGYDDYTVLTLTQYDELSALLASGRAVGIEVTTTNAIDASQVSRLYLHTKTSTEDGTNNKILELLITTNMTAGEARMFYPTSENTTSDSTRISSLICEERTRIILQNYDDFDLDIVPSSSSTDLTGDGTSNINTDAQMTTIKTALNTTDAVLLHSSPSDGTMVSTVKSSETDKTEFRINHDIVETQDNHNAMVSFKTFKEFDSKMEDIYNNAYNTYTQTLIKTDCYGIETQLNTNDVCNIEGSTNTIVVYNDTPITDGKLQLSSIFKTGNLVKLLKQSFTLTYTSLFVDVAVGDGQDNIVLPSGVWDEFDNHPSSYLVVRFANVMDTDVNRVINFIDPDDDTKKLYIAITNKYNGTDIVFDKYKSSDVITLTQRYVLEDMTLSKRQKNEVISVQNDVVDATFTEFNANGFTEGVYFSGLSSVISALENGYPVDLKFVSEYLHNNNYGIYLHNGNLSLFVDFSRYGRENQFEQLDDTTTTVERFPIVLDYIDEYGTCFCLPLEHNRLNHDDYPNASVLNISAYGDFYTDVPKSITSTDMTPFFDSVTNGKTMILGYGTKQITDRAVLSYTDGTRTIHVDTNGYAKCRDIKIQYLCEVVSSTSTEIFLKYIGQFGNKTVVNYVPQMIITSPDNTIVSKFRPELIRPSEFTLKRKNINMARYNTLDFRDIAEFSELFAYIDNGGNKEDFKFNMKTEDSYTPNQLFQTILNARGFEDVGVTTELVIPQMTIPVVNGDNEFSIDTITEPVSFAVVNGSNVASPLYGIKVGDTFPIKFDSVGTIADGDVLYTNSTNSSDYIYVGGTDLDVIAESTGIFTVQAISDTGTVSLEFQEFVPTVGNTAMTADFLSTPTTPIKYLTVDLTRAEILDYTNNKLPANTLGDLFTAHVDNETIEITFTNKVNDSLENETLTIEDVNGTVLTFENKYNRVDAGETGLYTVYYDGTNYVCSLVCRKVRTYYDTFKQINLRATETTDVGEYMTESVDVTKKRISIKLLIKIYVGQVRVANYDVRGNRITFTHNVSDTMDDVLFMKGTGLENSNKAEVVDATLYGTLKTAIEADETVVLKFANDVKMFQPYYIIKDGNTNSDGTENKILFTLLQGEEYLASENYVFSKAENTEGNGVYHLNPSSIAYTGDESSCTLTHTEVPRIMTVPVRTFIRMEDALRLNRSIKIYRDYTTPRNGYNPLITMSDCDSYATGDGLQLTTSATSAQTKFSYMSFSFTTLVPNLITGQVTLTSALSTGNQFTVSQLITSFPYTVSTATATADITVPTLSDTVTPLFRLSVKPNVYYYNVINGAYSAKLTMVGTGDLDILNAYEMELVDGVYETVRNVHDLTETDFSNKLIPYKNVITNIDTDANMTIIKDSMSNSEVEILLESEPSNGNMISKWRSEETDTTILDVNHQIVNVHDNHNAVVKFNNTGGVENHNVMKIVDIKDTVYEVGANESPSCLFIATKSILGE
jgi:hypothetical protein